MARYGFSPSGNPLTKYVNLHQTKEERREKYNYCRAMGFNTSWSRGMRDWRWKQIQRRVSADAMAGKIQPNI